MDQLIQLRENYGLVHLIQNLIYNVIRKNQTGLIVILPKFSHSVNMVYINVLYIVIINLS